MKHTQPVQLHACRVYFTELDRVTYSQVAWTPEDVERIKRDLTRKLKLLSIVKGHVVIAASHLLESEFAREIILPYPELFSNHVVVPALRSEFSSCEAFLDAKQNSEAPGERDLYCGNEQREMANMIDANATVMRWNMSETSGWFKKRLLDDLRGENSLVALHLRRKGLRVPPSICPQIESAPNLSRGFVYKLTEKYGNLELREAINEYTDFLYYLSGAKAVDSEGILPQENIIDFHLSDLEQRKSALSEHEVFFKIFVDIVKAATSSHFPTDFLDALTIGDAVELHNIAINDEFIEKYNTIQERTKNGLEMSDPERLIFLMNELAEFEFDLHKQFTDAIDRELPPQMRQMKRQKGADFIHALASLIVAPYGMAVGARDVLVSGLRFIKQDAIAVQIEKRINDLLHALKHFIEKSSGEERPILLQFVNKMKSEYIGKLDSHLN